MAHRYEILEIMIAHHVDTGRYIGLDQMIAELGPIKVGELMEAMGLFDQWLLEQRMKTWNYHHSTLQLKSQAG